MAERFTLLTRRGSGALEAKAIRAGGTIADGATIAIRLVTSVPTALTRSKLTPENVMLFSQVLRW